MSVVWEHGFHPLRVRQIVQETVDTRTYVFVIPDDLRDLFTYRPGQYCTVRVRIEGDEVLRCYSMSSAPTVDADLAVTVKRVPHGIMSNWLHDHVSVGDTLELLKPAGTFCPADTDDAPIVGFCGGSGVTPVFSILKHALVTTPQLVKLFVAHRDRDSIIFHNELERLRTQYPDRFTVQYHLDDVAGYVDPAAVRSTMEGTDTAKIFICGPTPFMNLVESALAGAGVDPGQIAIERFVAGGVAPIAEPSPPVGAGPELGDGLTETLTIVLKGKKAVVTYTPGDTVLDAARRVGLKPPFSCELGNCASCMALVTSGVATMRANNALTPDEVSEGWVLTCQALPKGQTVRVEYERL